MRGKHCDGIAGIIKEARSVMEEDFDDATMDACLIASAQRAEHYEMAAYGTLVAWARALGHTGAADLLQQTLDEEQAANQKLSGLAEGGINQEAAGRARPSDAAAEAPARGKKAKTKGEGPGEGPGQSPGQGQVRGEAPDTRLRERRESFSTGHGPVPISGGGRRRRGLA